MTGIEAKEPSAAPMKAPTLSAPELSRFYIDSSVVEDDMVSNKPSLVESSSFSSDDDYNYDGDTASENDCCLVESIEGTVKLDLGTNPAPTSRRKLHWKFHGLTLWLELEEFNSDITDAIRDFSSRHNSPLIPKSHTTAIYGMKHLSVDEAKAKLQKVRDTIPQWPAFERPTGVVSDTSEAGRPGQVCTIAWSELTLATDARHEAALDELYRVFFGPSSSIGASEPQRCRPWKPHNSIAYDNPEDNALSLSDTVLYMSQHPTLLSEKRRVEAISLWSTEGTMEEWKCLDRVRFW